MGGGGGRGIGPEDISQLERVARDAIREGATPTKRNIFICFATEDLDEVNLLRGQAKIEHSDLEFNDWSLREPFDSEKADYIKRGIRERIRQSSVTLVYISESTAQSKWVDWEIRESLRLGKGVVGMYKGERPPLKLPPAIPEHNIKIVPWSHKEIMAALDRAAESR